MATGSQVVTTPDVLGGKPRLKNHRISVADVVEHLRAGASVAEVADRLELSESEVKAAREYWHDHPDEINDDLASRDELYAELQESSRASS
jgi:uncharacterized protein (DUF433 family)